MLDKNNNTWDIICRKHYIDLHHKEFKNEQYYQFINNNPKLLIKRIEDKYKETILPICTQKFNMKKFWKLSRAYLLPKNKDQNRTRPIVSYYHHYSKNLGEKVARALTIIIKILTLKWNTYELHNINDVLPQLIQHKNSATWKKAIQQKNVTFMKFDIKSQFTNLNKERVLHAIHYAINYLKQNSTRKLFLHQK